VVFTLRRFVPMSEKGSWNRRAAPAGRGVIAALADAGVNIAGMRRILDLEKTVRGLQAKLSAFEALEAEMRSLKAEIASLREEDGKKPRGRQSRST
jgi:DNA-binding transcriptional MerR regulator